jgi:DNA invertase Pin-like site-specific DNA recombinase
MNVAGYIRVSTEQQKEEGSHERQREQLVEWADRQGHDLEVFEDIAISGQSDDRPAYDGLMDRAREGEFDAVAVRELSRFGRSLQQVLNDIDELAEHDVDFISVSESFDTSSAMGKAMMQMIGVFNEFWANLARERALENVERRRENGQPVGRPKKLDDGQIAECKKWADKGMSYATIAGLVGELYDIDVSRQTVRRYVIEEESDA